MNVLPGQFIRKSQAHRIFILLLSSSLIGCSVPGIKMGVSDTSDAPDSTADALARADVFPIDTATLQRLADETAAMPKPATKYLPKSDKYQYRVGPEDVLRITVWDHPELNNPGAISVSSLQNASPLTTTSSGAASLNPTIDATSRVVNNDGTMFYPYVGEINVAGKTVEEIRAFLTRALASDIKNPQIEVAVAVYRSKRAFVTGDVKVPGVVPITDLPLTIADAIAAAGGANADADLSSVTLTRATGTQQIDLYALLYAGDLSQNVLLVEDDILNIPEQRYNKVFVLGEVIKPTSIPMPRGIYTLNEALADVGGVNQNTAQASQIYVIRGTPAHPVIFHLDSTSAAALVLADQFLLRPRDIIFVDAAPIARFNRVVSQILPTLQALQAGKYLGQ